MVSTLVQLWLLYILYSQMYKPILIIINTDHKLFEVVNAFTVQHTGLVTSEWLYQFKTSSSCVDKQSCTYQAKQQQNTATEQE